MSSKGRMAKEFSVCSASKRKTSAETTGEESKKQCPGEEAQGNWSERSKQKRRGR